jgi:hypothetical protein
MPFLKNKHIAFINGFMWIPAFAGMTKAMEREVVFINKKSCQII